MDEDDPVRVLSARLAASGQALLGRSLAVRHVDAGSCGGCEIEIAACRRLRGGMAAHGIAMVEDLRAADILLVTGVATRNLAEAVRKSLAGMAPVYVIMPHTCFGYDLAPALAVRLGAACITAAEAARMNGGKAVFVRTASGGKLSTEVVPETDIVVLTNQPGAWKPLDNKMGTGGTVETVRSDAGPVRSRTVGFKQPEYRGNALAESSVVVAAGRGIGTRENLALIDDIARLFPRSAVGCSRAVCDAGWLGYAHQVGMTGATVSPKLYIAIGISGAVQHVAGIRDAQTVIAINNDPAARIFARADYGIVEDLTRFIPVLIEEYNKRYGTPQEA
jgi:electron transfer flavoprotein alpha subunit